MWCMHLASREAVQELYNTLFRAWPELTKVS